MLIYLKQFWPVGRRKWPASPFFFIAFLCWLVVPATQAQDSSPDLVVHSDEIRLDGTVHQVDFSHQRFTVDVDMLLLRDDMSGDIAAQQPRTIVLEPDCRLLDARYSVSTAIRFENLQPGVEMQIIGQDAGKQIRARLIIVTDGTLRTPPRPARRAVAPQTSHRRNTRRAARPNRRGVKPRHTDALLSRPSIAAEARRKGVKLVAPTNHGQAASGTMIARPAAIAPTAEKRSEIPPRLDMVTTAKRLPTPQSRTPAPSLRTGLLPPRVHAAPPTPQRIPPPTLALAPATTSSQWSKFSAGVERAAPSTANESPAPDRLAAVVAKPRVVQRPVEMTAPDMTLNTEPLTSSNSPLPPVADSLRPSNALAPMPSTPTLQGASRPLPVITVPALQTGESGTKESAPTDRATTESGATESNSTESGTRLAALPSPTATPTSPLTAGEPTGLSALLPENSPFWNPARQRFAALYQAQLELPYTYFSGGSQAHKLVALTFDDGPNPLHTPRVLDILKREGVPATFFLIGRNVEKHPDLVLRAVAEGHEIGNHTFQHKQGGHLTLQEWRNEIDATNVAIARLLGAAPRWFRAPGCRYSPATLQAIAETKMVRVDTTNNSSDWDGRSAQMIYDRIMQRLAPGNVLLFHDGMDQTALVLPRLIHAIRAQGYRFVTLTELARLSEETPGFQPVFHPVGQGIVISTE